MHSTTINNYSDLYFSEKKPDHILLNIEKHHKSLFIGASPRTLSFGMPQYSLKLPTQRYSATVPINMAIKVD
jgi:hypothetical protein